MLIWDLVLVFHVCQSSYFLRDSWILFQRLSQWFKLFNCTLWRTFHWQGSFFYSWFFDSIRTWTWHLGLIFAKSLPGRFELRSAGWIDFYDNAVTVWNCFDVGLDDTFADIVLPRACFDDGFLVKQSFPQSSGVEWGRSLWFAITVLNKVLSGTYRVGKFGDFIDFPLRLKHECHGVIRFCLLILLSVEFTSR